MNKQPTVYSLKFAVKVKGELYAPYVYSRYIQNEWLNVENVLSECNNGFHFLKLNDENSIFQYYSELSDRYKLSRYKSSRLKHQLVMMLCGIRGEYYRRPTTNIFREIKIIRYFNINSHDDVIKAMKHLEKNHPNNLLKGNVRKHMPNVRGFEQ